MKSKDYVVYVVFTLVFALLLLTPTIIDSVFAQDALLTNILESWLVHGENFVNSVGSAGFY